MELVPFVQQSLSHGRWVRALFALQSMEPGRSHDTLKAGSLIASYTLQRHWVVALKVAEYCSLSKLPWPPSSRKKLLWDISRAEDIPSDIRSDALLQLMSPHDEAFFGFVAAQLQPDNTHLSKSLMSRRASNVLMDAALQCRGSSLLKAMQSEDCNLPQAMVVRHCSPKEVARLGRFADPSAEAERIVRLTASRWCEAMKLAADSNNDSITTRVCAARLIFGQPIDVSKSLAFTSGAKGRQATLAKELLLWAAGRSTPNRASDFGYQGGPLMMRSLASVCDGWRRALEFHRELVAAACLPAPTVPTVLSVAYANLDLRDELPTPLIFDAIDAATFITCASHNSVLSWKKALQYASPYKDNHTVMRSVSLLVGHRCPSMWEHACAALTLRRSRYVWMASRWSWEAAISVATGAPNSEVRDVLDEIVCPDALGSQHKLKVTCATVGEAAAVAARGFRPVLRSAT